MILLWDVNPEEPLDERSRSLLKRLLDETAQRQQPVHPHADTPVLPVAPTPSDHTPKEAPKASPSAPPAADVVTRMEPPRPVESGGCHPLLFLAKPPASASERPTKPKPSTHPRHRRSRGHHTRRMGLLPPPGSPLRKADDSRRTTAPDADSSPESWAIVPANQAPAPFRQKRSRLEAVGLVTEKTPDRTPRWTRLGSESTRVGPLTHRVKSDAGQSACSARGGPSEHSRRTRPTESPDQTAVITKQKEPPDRGSTGHIARSSARDCPACAPSKRGHRELFLGTRRDTTGQTVLYPPPRNPRAHRVSAPHHSRPRHRERSPQREPSGRTSSATSGRARPSAKPVRRASSSSSRCYSRGGAVPSRKPHRRRAAQRQDSLGPAALYRQRSSTRWEAISTRHDSPPDLMMISRRKPRSGRPVVVSRISRAGESTAIVKADHRDKKVEKKEGQLKRLKDRLGLIFHHYHHQHHHHHHHHPPPNADEHGGRRRQHRSLGKLLGGIFHHKGGRRVAEGGRTPPPPKQQGQQRGYLHMLLEGLLRHVWRGAKRRKKRPPRPGAGAAGCGAVKKLHWWQRLRRRRRGLRVGSRRRPRLRLSFGSKKKK